MGDPSVTGGPNAMFTHIAYDLWNVEEASEWLRLLIKQQGVLVQRDHRLVGEWVAKGKYAIGVASRTPTVIKLLKAGAPITLAVQEDGHMVDCAGGALGVPAVSGPHPNAAAVFVNWLLTKEGQPFVSKGYGYPSMRPDVPIKGITPLCLPKPGEKLFFATEDSIAKRGPLMKVAGEVIKQASRK